MNLNIQRKMKDKNNISITSRSENAEKASFIPCQRLPNLFIALEAPESSKKFIRTSKIYVNALCA